MKDDNTYVATEARRTQEYIKLHPPLIPDSLLAKEIFRMDMEIACLERLHKIFEDAIIAKRAHIAEMEAELAALEPETIPKPQMPTDSARALADRAFGSEM